MKIFLGLLICVSSFLTALAATRIRLANNHGHANQGRVEMFDTKRGVWGTVCDDKFDTKAAGVVCYMLGYSRDHAQVRTKSYFGRGTGEIYYDDVVCNGFETDISQCQHATHDDCTHGEDVGVICQVNAASANCNFEDTSAQCHWANVHNENFDWVKHQGKTTSLDTGPSADHTYGTASGHYVYIEASSPRLVGDIARLVSPSLTPSTTRCLQFWYHMYGSSMGTLNVLVMTATGNTTVWSLSGNQGNRWNLGRVPVTSTHPYKVAFEGVRGASYYSDIAIDDISFSSTMCTVSPSTAATASSKLAVRLVDPHGIASQGRLEVFYDGSWGTVCDDKFDANAAAVVCNMLGYDGEAVRDVFVYINAYLSSRARVTVPAQFGPGSGKVYLDDVVCNGHETSIDQCKANPIGVTDCTHAEDIGVVCSAECSHVKADIVFMLDSSSSEGAMNFEKQKEFVSSFVNSLNIGPSNMQVGVLTFSSSTHVNFFLNTYHSKSQVVNAVQKIPYITGSTHTDSALRTVWAQMFQKHNGDRDHAQNILYVLTDGNSIDRLATITEAKHVRDNNIKTYAIGIGSSVGARELDAIALTKNYVLKVADFSNLHLIPSKLQKELCSTTPLTTPKPSLNCRGKLCSGYNDTCILHDYTHRGHLTSNCQHNCNFMNAVHYQDCHGWPNNSCCCRTQQCIDQFNYLTPPMTTVPTTPMPTTEPPCMDHGPAGYCNDSKETICNPIDERGWDYAKNMCPVTCGLCMAHLRHDCEDNDRNGYCEVYKNSICRAADPQGKEFAINACAKTCNMCAQYFALYKEKHEFTTTTIPTTTSTTTTTTASPTKIITETPSTVSLTTTNTPTTATTAEPTSTTPEPTTTTPKPTTTTPKPTTTTEPTTTTPKPTTTTPKPTTTTTTPIPTTTTPKPTTTTPTTTTEDQGGVIIIG